MQHSRTEKYLMLTLGTVLFLVSLAVSILTTLSWAHTLRTEDPPLTYFAASVLMTIAMFLASVVMLIIIIRRYLGDPATDSLAEEEAAASRPCAVLPLADYDNLSPDQKMICDMHLDGSFDNLRNLR